MAQFHENDPFTKYQKEKRERKCQKEKKKKKA